jgi:hypothetical protein
MKDFKFCFVLFFSVGVSSAQTDYNKVDERKKKWGLEGFYQSPKTKV